MNEAGSIDYIRLESKYKYWREVKPKNVASSMDDIWLESTEREMLILIILINVSGWIVFIFLNLRSMIFKSIGSQLHIMS